MYVAEIREICGDYAIDIKHGVLNKEALTLYFNSRKNAEMVKYIIEVDSSVPNVATVADVVEVVRCKDCKWWYNETDCRNTSGLYRFVPNGNWFCASGERRDDRCD